MGNWPFTLNIPGPLPTIDQRHWNALGGPFYNRVGGNSTSPVAATAYMYPFRLSEPVVVTKLYWLNGTASGNLDVGIYDHAGRRLVSIGSTAQSGTGAIQIVDVTDTEIGPGLFYMALVKETTGGSVSVFNLAVSIQRAMGCVQASSAFPLPDTVTFEALANPHTPASGAVLNRTVF
jgi:hypothetical protein